MPRRLRPIRLPFMICPDTPYLRLLTEESGETWCEFAAYFGPQFEPDDEAGDGSGEAAVTVGSPLVLVVEPPAFMAAPEESTGREPYRWVRATFELAYRATFELIDEYTYEDDEIEGEEPWTEDRDLDDWLRRRREDWLSTGLTNSGIYEVVNTDQGKADSDYRELYLGGHDAAVTVACRGFRWEVLRDLPGW